MSSGGGTAFPGDPGLSLGPQILVPPPSGDVSGATDAALIAAAAAKLPGGKGTLLFQGGIYRVNSLPVPTNYSIWQGMSGLNAGAGPATLITYSGSAARLVDARGLTGFQVKDLMLFCNNAAFLGTVLDLSAGSALSRVEGCYIGAVDTTTAIMVDTDQMAGGATLLQNNLVGGLIGLRGIGTAAHFSNALEMLGNRIGGQGAAGACISGPGQGWSIRGNDFELTNGQKAVAAGPTAAAGIEFSGNWIGDAVAALTVVMQIFANGFSIRGNFIGGFPGKTGIQFSGASDGIEIAANRFDTHNLAIDKNAQVVTAQIGPNSYVNTTTHHNFVAAGAPFVEA